MDLDNMTEEQAKKIIKSLPQVHLVIEKHQGHLYAWDRDTNKFLGQGPNKEALFERLAEQAKKSVAFHVAKEYRELLEE